jgi:dethiobiotin synthetase
MDKQLRIFIAGDKSSCGKSSICLSLISFIEKYESSATQEQQRGGIAPVGYIKPCTQCIDTQLVWKYCYTHQLPFTGMGPIIYYNGFTSDVQQEQKDLSVEQVYQKESERVQKAKASVEELKSKWVIVDGIGFSSVGSVVGCSNARLAHELDAPVLLVVNMENGSLGNAIDNFNLNCLYMEHYYRQERMLDCESDMQTYKRRVIGVIFNKIPKDLYEQRKRDICIYFKTHVRKQIKLYGFIPLEEEFNEHADKSCVKETCMSIPMSRNDPSIKVQSAKKHELLQMNKQDQEKAENMFKLFSNHIDVKQILLDVEEFHQCNAKESS